MKVYTKTGDKGETGLVGGTRVSKSEPRIDLYGEVDELNSVIGLGVSYLDKKQFSKEIRLLQKIQNNLFNLGSQLACEADKREQFKLPQIEVNLIADLEAEIDNMDESLEPLKNFILPGGTQAAAAFHLARTVTRRVERKGVGFNEAPSHMHAFLNRLSDYFFVLSRYINKVSGKSDIEWTH